MEHLLKPSSSHCLHVGSSDDQRRQGGQCWESTHVYNTVVVSASCHRCCRLQFSEHVGFYRGRQPLPHFTHSVTADLSYWQLVCWQVRETLRDGPLCLWDEMYELHHYSLTSRCRLMTCRVQPVPGLMPECCFNSLACSSPVCHDDQTVISLRLTATRSWSKFSVYTTQMVTWSGHTKPLYGSWGLGLWSWWTWVAVWSVMKAAGESCSVVFNSR